MYEKLLKAGLEAGYEHVTVREYLTHSSLPENVIIHRHDVDRKPENALSMAQLEYKYDITSTYYFRTIDKTFKPELIHEIEKQGHEIGYHYEDVDRAEGDIEVAHELFKEHLEKVRTHATVDTICMHGNPLTDYDNRTMWNADTYDSYGLLGEAYLSIDFTDVIYFSDTGRTWLDGSLKIKDHPVGDSRKERNVETTTELINLISSQELDRLYILSHPNRWSETFIEYVGEMFKDVATNLGKRLINIRQ